MNRTDNHSHVRVIWSPSFLLSFLSLFLDFLSYTHISKTFIISGHFFTVAFFLPPLFFFYIIPMIPKRVLLSLYLACSRDTEAVLSLSNRTSAHLAIGPHVKINSLISREILLTVHKDSLNYSKNTHYMFPCHHCYTNYAIRIYKPYIHQGQHFRPQMSL